MSFWLIQRGEFKTKDLGQDLIGDKGIIRLDYMGSAEFEFGTIPKAYKKIMAEFENYSMIPTGIKTPDGEELLVFCNKKYSKEIVDDLNKFVTKPYSLQEYSELERIPTSKAGCEWYDKRRSDFWWCIDNKADWMACLQSKKEAFLKAINHDYRAYWLPLPADKKNPTI